MTIKEITALVVYLTMVTFYITGTIVLYGVAFNYDPKLGTLIICTSGFLACKSFLKGLI